MGNARPRLKLMPEKLLLIREYLNVSKPVMAQLLELSKTGRVSEYENGVREPNLMVTLAYSRLGK
jgi:DNA-binding transcriptional regulator YiaG